MDLLDHDVQLSSPAVDGDLPGRSAQLLARQERRESDTRAGRREHQGRRPDDLRLDLQRRIYEVGFSPPSCMSSPMSCASTKQQRTALL